MLVGKVVNGFVSTTLLDVNKRYDFKAVWGSSVKVVYDKYVFADNSGAGKDKKNVGGGVKAGITNLNILKGKCDMLL